MSDPQEPGEPVEEPTPVHDDVVGRANEGLADAEAAGRSATDGGAPSAASGRPGDAAAEDEAAEAAPAEAPAAAETVSADIAAAETAAGDDAVADAAAPQSPAQPAEPSAGSPSAPEHEAVSDSTAATPAAATSAAATPASTSVGDVDDEPVFATPALNDVHGTYGENVDTAATEAYDASRTADAAALGAGAAASVPGEPAAPQPIFVQAPEEPRPRGNRGAAGGIGLVAAICFAALYLASGLVIGLVSGDVAGDGIVTWLTDTLATLGLWVPTIVFFIAFWLLGAIINRGRWGAWVIIGLLVGVAAWGGHLLGQLFDAPFWTITASEGAEIVNEQLFAPLAIAAFVIGRELTIWFGAWAAARGKRMTELNVEARREYERTLEAGPQLAR